MISSGLFKDLFEWLFELFSPILIAIGRILLIPLTIGLVVLVVYIIHKIISYRKNKFLKPPKTPKYSKLPKSRPDYHMTSTNGYNMTFTPDYTSDTPCTYVTPPIKTPVKNDGKQAEIYIATMIKLIMTGEYEIYQNLIVPVAEGKTTEIDILLVSCYGIFVIEVKDWAGKIDLNKYSEYAEVYNKTFYYPLSPIKQNTFHCDALAHLLKENNYNMVPMIVFTKAKYVTNKSNKGFIGKSNNLFKYIKKCTTVYNDSDKLKRINQTILENTLTGHHALENHINSLSSGH